MIFAINDFDVFISKMKEYNADEVFLNKEVREISYPFANVFIALKFVDQKGNIWVYADAKLRCDMTNEKDLKDVENLEKDLKEKLVKAGRVVIYGDIQ